jgi:hypothetical protein
MTSSLCERFKALKRFLGAGYASRVLPINGEHEPQEEENRMMAETPTLYVCHGDDGARGCIHVAGCRRHSVLRESTTRR